MKDKIHQKNLQADGVAATTIHKVASAGDIVGTDESGSDTSSADGSPLK